jgi:hypothetical protein
MTDIQKSLVSTSVAATRSGNMFQTLMEGMSEDGGKQFEEYLNLAENSEGITNKKYEVSVRSLSAAIDTLTASYDKLISGIESSQIGQTVLDFVSGVLEGFGTLNEELPGVAVGLTSIIVPLSIIAGLFAMMKGGSGFGLITGLTVAGLGLWVGSEFGQKTSKTVKTKNTPIGLYNDTYNAISDKQDKRENLIEETKELGQKYSELGSEMDDADLSKFKNNINSLIMLFPE